MEGIRTFVTSVKGIPTSRVDSIVEALLREFASVSQMEAVNASLLARIDGLSLGEINLLSQAAAHAGTPSLSDCVAIPSEVVTKSVYQRRAIHVHSLLSALS